MPLVAVTKPTDLTLVSLAEGRLALFNNNPQLYNNDASLIQSDSEITAALFDGEETLSSITQRTVVPTRYRWTFSRFPIRLQPLPVPRPPVTEVHRLRWRFSSDPDWNVSYPDDATDYTDEAGDTVAIPADATRFTLSGDRIYPQDGWPLVQGFVPLIAELEYSAGYSATNIPRSFKSAAFGLLLARTVPQGSTAAALAAVRNAALAGVVDYRLSITGHPSANAEINFGG